MYYVNYPTCFPLFIQFMQSYGKYNNVQKFFSFFVDYEGVKKSARTQTSSGALLYAESVLRAQSSSRMSACPLSGARYTCPT